MSKKRPIVPLIKKRDVLWTERLKIFRDVFPWTNVRIRELAGLSPNAVLGPGGKHEDNLAFIRAHELYLDGGNAKDKVDAIRAIHQEQNAAWKELTGFPSALGDEVAWRAAALAAGAPRDALETMDIKSMAGYITAWALSLRAKQPGKAAIQRTPSSASSYSKSDLKVMTGLGDTTITKFTKIARVTTPGRGAKNHRYTSEETRKIVIAIRDGTQDTSVKRRCNEALDELA